ncbi:hypothetical protein WA026_012455 [Henosepilachna vigintioctopunctata]|uniref:Radial spoke head protein 9 homolog n=1 Tax=Henosepilachna vigintioctopunctata TaxID=420089 RepID=A0AAW1UX41_9CUCU
MNLESVLGTLESLGYVGHTISTEEGIILHNSLMILQNENHFRNTFFWGRIFGVEKDYYIAFGYVKDVLKGRVFYYSIDCINWGLLPNPTIHAKKVTPFCNTKFQGDPSLVIDVLIEKEEISWDEPLKKAIMQRLKEEDRLSVTVHTITYEASVVPRGGLFMRPDGVAVENLSFEGLTLLDSRELSSYQHYRLPIQKWNTNLLTRDDYNYATDFLDPLDIDIPEGCWPVQILAGDTVAIVKSLYWPGLYFYHTVETPKYGFIYFGTGKKCLDTTFMLLPST